MVSSSKWLAALCVLALCALGTGCGAESGCKRQCEILSDCDAVPRSRISACIDTCESLLSDECDDDEGCVRSGPGGDPEECARALLDVNEEADGNECSNDFASDWCDTYYNDPACAPFTLGGITCSGGE